MTVFNPKFLELNNIGGVSEIADSAGTSDKTRKALIDKNNETKWESVGETSGTRTITWTPAASKIISRIYFQGINWKDFAVKYDTSNDFSPAISVASNTYSNFYIEVSAQAVSNVVISITDTFNVGEVAQCTQIYFGNEFFEIPIDEGGEPLYFALPDVKQTVFNLSDGSTSKVYVRSVLNYDLAIQLVDDDSRDNYIALYQYNRTKPFVFIPAPVTTTEWDGIANHYNWTNPGDYFNYTNDVSVNGYNVNMALRQSQSG